VFYQGRRIKTSSPLFIEPEIKVKYRAIMKKINVFHLLAFVICFGMGASAFADSNHTGAEEINILKGLESTLPSDSCTITLKDVAGGLELTVAQKDAAIGIPENPITVTLSSSTQGVFISSYQSWANWKTTFMSLKASDSDSWSGQDFISASSTEHGYVFNMRLNGLLISCD
jgi:hypothetical protein